MPTARYRQRLLLTRKTFSPHIGSILCSRNPLNSITFPIPTHLAFHALQTDRCGGRDIGMTIFGEILECGDTLGRG